MAACVTRTFLPLGMTCSPATNWLGLYIWSLIRHSCMGPKSIQLCIRNYENHHTAHLSSKYILNIWYLYTHLNPNEKNKAYIDAKVWRPIQRHTNFVNKNFTRFPNPYPLQLRWARLLYTLQTPKTYQRLLGGLGNWRVFGVLKGHCSVLSPSTPLCKYWQPINHGSRLRVNYHEFQLHRLVWESGI